MRWSSPQTGLRAPLARDQALDAARGLCIVGMVVGHVAGNSTLSAIVFLPIWVDGATGFVFLSGLVLAIYQRRLWERGAPEAGWQKLVKRIRQLYALHLLVAFVSIAVGTWFTSPLGLPSADSAGWTVTALKTVLFQINPPMSILGMYVVFLVASLGALSLLRRGRWRVVFAFSVAVFVIGHALGRDTALPGQSPLQAFQLTAWQLLFITGMLIGWHWNQLNVRALIARRMVWIPCLAFSIAFALLGDATYRRNLVSGQTRAEVLWTFDKLNLGPGAIIYLLTFGVALYVGLTALSSTKLGAKAVTPLSVLGTNGLGAYVVSTIAATVLPTLLGYTNEGLEAEMLAAATIVALIVWSYIRRARRQRSTAADVPRLLPRPTEFIRAEPRPIANSEAT